MSRNFKRRRRTARLLAQHLAGERPAGAELVRLVAKATAGEEITVEQTGGDLGGGVIRNVAVMTVGVATPLMRPPFEIDETTLSGLVSLINDAADGVRSHVTHPELQEGPGTGYVDGMLWLIGRCQHARLVGAGESRQVRADFHIGSYADDGPNGKLGSFVKGIALKAPADIAVSVVAGFMMQSRGPDQMPLARTVWCDAADFVEIGGSNPNGLLSGRTNQNRGAAEPAQNHQGDDAMKLNLRQRAYLAGCGLALSATEAEVTTFLAGLKPEQKAILESLKDEPAPKPGDNPPAPPTPLAGDRNTPPASPAVTAEQRAEIERNALAADKTRRDGIIALAKEKKLPESWAQGLCDRGVPLASARELAELAETQNLVNQPAGSRVTVGEDRALAGLRPAMTDAILLRGNVPLYEFDRFGRVVRETPLAGEVVGRPKTRKPAERAEGFAALSFVRLAGQYLRLHGVEHAELMGDRDTLDLAMTGRLDRGGEPVHLAMSTSDFPSVLGNVMRATVRAMYADAEQTAIFNQWCGRVVLPDYRPMDLISVSETPDLMLRPEGQDVRFATFTDGHESVQVFMFSRGMSFTQQAQRNDSFGIFARQIRNFASAAIRLMDRMTTAILTVNANMADNLALFVGGHRNVSANVAPSVAAISAARLALATQLGMRTAEDGDNGPAIMNIPLRNFVCAKALEDTFRVIVGSQFDPTAGAGLNQENPVRNAGAVVGNPYLDVTSATTWFATGDPNGPGGGVQAAFLQGEETPEVRSQVNFRTGDLEVVCEAKGGAKADDWRGLYRGNV